MPSAHDHKTPPMDRLLRAVVVLLIMFPPWFLMTPAVAMHEVGDSADEDPAGKFDPGWLEPEIDLVCGRRFFSEDVTAGVYDSLPLFQARFSFLASHSPRAVRLFLGAGYGWSDGDAYFDRPSFTGGHEADLRVVPIQAGIRFDLLSGRRWHLQGNILVEAVWSRETLPSPSPFSPDDSSRVSGWTNGVGATIGPQWRSADRKRALGLELGATGNSGPNRGDTKREMNLSGYVCRLYFSTRI